VRFCVDVGTEVGEDKREAVPEAGLRPLPVVLGLEEALELPPDSSAAPVQVPIDLSMG
jgi:hypothetical protein